MSRPTPTLINLPPPPSANDTPSEAPGTPNSTTTSLSALSTTAIKDGHRGASLPNHTHHSHSRSANLEAAAYRISNLAGLSAATQQSANAQNPNAGPGSTTGYFDAAGNPVYRTKISTVGSASATDVEAGSTGGRTTGTTNWGDQGNHRDSVVSGSGDSGSRIDSEFQDAASDEGGETEGELDKMSTDGDRHSMSMRMDEDGDGEGAAYDSDDDNRDGMSDEGNASLVGFGEGAGSTVSGPISSYGGLMRDGNMGLRGSGGGSSASAMRALNGSTSTGNGPPMSAAQQTAERVVRERLGETGEGKGVPPLGSPDEQNKGLGKFYFEDEKGSK